MNSKIFQTAILSLLFLTIGCTKSAITSNDNNTVNLKYNTQVDFGVTIETVDIEVGVTPILTRNSQNDISYLWYALYDETGTPVPSVNGEVMRYVDYANTVNVKEMLPQGNYTAVFLGFSHGVNPENQIQTINKMSDKWLTTAPTASANGIYYYYKGALKVTKNQTNKFDVPLKPIVGQFVLNLNMAQGQRVKKVEVQFNTPTYTSFDADQTYGNPSAANLTTTLDFNHKFYSLPTVGEVASGKVMITIELVGGKLITRQYSFENLPIQAGKVTTLNLTLDLDYQSLGMIHVDHDFSTATDHATMLQDNEDQSVYGIGDDGSEKGVKETDIRRSFKANAPLRVSIREKSLEFQFYSFKGISDVDIYMDIAGIEPFKVCHIDHMPALKEFKIPFAVASTEASYETMSGKIIKLPAMPELTNEMAKFIVKSKDPYFIKNIEPLKCRWICCFRNNFVNADGRNVKPMTPKQARQGLAVMLNMAYMFSTDKFRNELYARQGTFYWDGPTYNPDPNSRLVDVQEFYKKLIRLERFGVSLLKDDNKIKDANNKEMTAEGFMYNSYYITLRANYFTSHFTATDSFVWFHEFAHILGAYDSQGSLTGGYDKRGWTGLTSDIYLDMVTREELPVYNVDMTTF